MSITWPKVIEKGWSQAKHAFGHDFGFRVDSSICIRGPVEDLAEDGNRSGYGRSTFGKPLCCVVFYLLQLELGFSDSRGSAAGRISISAGVCAMGGLDGEETKRLRI